METKSIMKIKVLRADREYLSDDFQSFLNEMNVEFDQSSQQPIHFDKTEYWDA